MTTTVDYYVAGQQELLARLVKFSATPEYQHLLRFLRDRFPGGPELWFAEWLIAPEFGFDEYRPIDVVASVGGIDLVRGRLLREVYRSVKCG